MSVLIFFNIFVCLKTAEVRYDIAKLVGVYHQVGWFPDDDDFDGKIRAS